MFIAFNNSFQAYKPGMACSLFLCMFCLINTFTVRSDQYIDTHYNFNTL